MPLFSYRAVDTSGKTVKGSIYARNREVAKERINGSGLVTVQIWPGNKLREKLEEIVSRRVGIKSISIFCRQLYIIVKSGVNILDGLEVLFRETKNRAMKNVLKNIVGEVQRGRLISEAMDDAGNSLPPLLVNMVAAGEVSGNLDEILRRLAIYYEKEAYTRDKMRAVLVYPVVLLIIGFLMLMLFANYVLPEIVSVIKESNGELPLITRVVISIFDFIREYAAFLFAGLIGMVVLSNVIGTNDRLRLARDRFIMRLPVISISIKNIVTSRFTRTMSIMLKGGIPLIKALESSQNVVGNAIVETGINNAISGIKMGGRLGDNLAKCHFFDLIVIHMIGIGEETGDLDDMMDTVADYYDKESETWTLKLMSSAEPVFTIFMGLVIGVLIISLLLPIFNMMSQLSY